MTVEHVSKIVKTWKRYVFGVNQRFPGIATYTTLNKVVQMTELPFRSFLHDEAFEEFDRLVK